MKKRNILYTILTIVFIIIVGVVAFFLPKSFMTNNIQTTNVSLNVFDSILSSHRERQVAEIHINNDNMAIVTFEKDMNIITCVLPKNNTEIIQRILSNNITLYLESHYRISTFKFAFVQLLQTLLQIFAQITFLRYVFGVNRHIHDDQEEENEEKIRKIKFSDVIGMEKEKEKLRDIYNFFKDAPLRKKLGFKIQNGVIMSGPPGNGKTYLARALSGEFKCHFISTSATEFIEIYVGTGPLKVREIYEEAREFAIKNKTPSIVFIDEADSLGRRDKSGYGGGSSEEKRTINQLLVELDGANNNESVLTILATNYEENIDPAILRSGRIGSHISIDNPSLFERKVLIEKTIERLPLTHRVNINDLVSLTAGDSRATITALIEESFQYELQQANKKGIHLDNVVVTQATIYEIKMQQEVGQKTDMIYTERELINTTYHEVGHAFVTYYFKSILTKMIMITIECRSRVLGFVSSFDDERNMIDLDVLRARICVLLAGTLCEKIFQNRRTPGCGSDIKHARNLAEVYTMYGMNDKYGLHHITSKQTSGYDSMMSEKEKETIYNEATKLINELTEWTYNLLIENKAKIEKFTQILRKELTIRGDDIYTLFDDKEMSKSLVVINYKSLYETL